MAAGVEGLDAHGEAFLGGKQSMGSLGAWMWCGCIGSYFGSWLEGGGGFVCAFADTMLVHVGFTFLW